MKQEWKSPKKTLGVQCVIKQPLCLGLHFELVIVPNKLSSTVDDINTKLDSHYEKFVALFDKINNLRSPGRQNDDHSGTTSTRVCVTDVDEYLDLSLKTQTTSYNFWFT